MVGDSRTIKRRMLYLLHKHHVNFIIMVLLCASVYYFLGAVHFKRRIGSNAPEFFETDEIVTILDVIDGDEILISNSDEVKTVLRILGIKSFDPSVSDPLLSEYGKICFNYLKKITVNGEGRIKIEDKKIDEEGRLIGSIYLKDDQDQFTVDVAGDLILKGYTLVYTKYGFAEMGAYLAIQDTAKQNNAGFWGDTVIASRAELMIKMWSQEKLDD